MSREVPVSGAGQEQQWEQRLEQHLVDERACTTADSEDPDLVKKVCVHPICCYLILCWFSTLSLY
jgi:hypothetical protein